MDLLPDRDTLLNHRIRRAILVLLYLVILSLAFFMLSAARPAIQFTLNILSPFIVALIVAYIFNPVVNYLQHQFRLGRIAGVVITYTIILVITAAFFAILLPILYLQLRSLVQTLISNLPNVADKAMAWMQVRLSTEEIEQLKLFFREQVDLEGLQEQAGPVASRVARQALDTGKVVTQVVVTSVSLILGFFAFVSFVVMITFYFLLDYHRMEHVARVLLPDEQESRVFGLWQQIDRALGGFLRGQLLVAMSVGILYTIALMALGMKQYAILIGFAAGFGNLIPYIGPIVGGVPTALWVIFSDRFGTGQEKMIGLGAVVAFSIAIQSLDGFYLQPRIVGQKAELHPLLVLLALLVGAQFGLGGMIVAVPVAIACRVLLKELWWKPLEQVEMESKRQALEERVKLRAPESAE